MHGNSHCSSGKQSETKLVAFLLWIPGVALEFGLRIQQIFNKI